MTFYYAMTLRKTQHPVFITDYQDHMTMLIKKYPYANFEYHYEGTKGLHLHAMVASSKSLHIRQIHPNKGWNLDFKKVKDRDAWNRYITKDRAYETELINHEYSILQDFLDFQNSSGYLHTCPYTNDEDSNDETNKIIKRTNGCRIL